MFFKEEAVLSGEGRQKNVLFTTVPVVQEGPAGAQPLPLGWPNPGWEGCRGDALGPYFSLGRQGLGRAFFCQLCVFVCYIGL